MVFFMPKTAEAVVAKRPYLSKSKRKSQLVEAAANLVETQGWPALSMTTLADHVGVSRQLVYQHFPSLGSLLTATARSIFNDTMQDTVTAIAANSGDIRMAIGAAADVSLDMPNGRGDALWQMIAGMGSGLDELEVIRVSIRDIIIGLWTPMAQKQLGLCETDAKALVWMMLMSFWGIRNLVRDGVMSRQQGLQAFGAHAERVFSQAGR